MCLQAAILDSKYLWSEAFPRIMGISLSFIYGFCYNYLQVAGGFAFR